MTVPVVHSQPWVREVVRRGIRGRRVQVVTCRGLDRVEKLLLERLIDGIVVDVREVDVDTVLGFRRRFPNIPVFAVSSFRPDDGRLLLTIQAAHVHVLTEGVDDAIVGEYVFSRTAAAKRRELLREAPTLLRLTEDIQLRVWDEIQARVGSVIRTAALADTMDMSREHLSREFAAGDAPNLKRVIDLARIACAAHMLANPAYTVEAVSRILGFSSPSHLAGSSSRIAGLKPSQLAEIGPRGVLNKFRGGRTRSRL